MSSDYNFRNLVLWQKAQALTLEIVQLTNSIPRSVSADVIVRQVVRSSSSIAANMAEGHGRYAPRAHANHLLIARGSTCETDSWLDLLAKIGAISRDVEARLHAVCLELVAMLTSKIRDLERLPNYRQIRDEGPVWDVGRS